MGGYIGNEPTTGHFPVDNFTSSGGSTYTLSKAPASAGAIEVSVQGVLQPTTAYTVSGTTLTMAGVTSGVKIFVRHLGETLTLPTIADGVVTTAKLGVNSVDGTKIAMGSDARGDILYHGATDYARLAKGTSGQVLTMGANDPAWAAPAAGGAWNYISSATASTSSSLDFTSGIDSTYDVYLFSCVDLEFSANCEIRVRTGAGSFDTGASDYEISALGYATYGNQPFGDDADDAIIISKANYQAGATDKSASLRLLLYAPSDTTHLKKIEFYFIGEDSSGRAQFQVGVGQRSSTSAITRLQLYPHTGTITSGTIRMYGLAKS